MSLRERRVSHRRHEYRTQARISRRIVAGDMSREGRDAGPSKMQTFECSLCGIEVSFDYKGRTPPYEKGIVYVPARHFDDCIHPRVCGPIPVPRYTHRFSRALTISLFSFLEDGYFRQDPFADRRRPLFIGADCSLCSRPVCGQPTCSLFYTRRFCARCAKKNVVSLYMSKCAHRRIRVLRRRRHRVSSRQR